MHNCIQVVLRIYPITKQITQLMKHNAHRAILFILIPIATFI